MKYADFENAFSAARLNKYRKACNGNDIKALTLYRHNVKLCQKFYGVLNVFEIVLRNAINKHYTNHFNDADWIFHQLQVGGMLEHSPQQKDVLDEIQTMVKTTNIHLTKLSHQSVLVFGPICSLKYLFVSEIKLCYRSFQTVKLALDKKPYIKSFSKSNNFGIALPTMSRFVLMQRDIRVWFMHKPIMH